MSNRKIGQQLYMIYVLAVFFPIAVIGSFLLVNTSKLLTNYYRNLLESDNLRVKTILFELTTQVYNISESISFEDSLQKILSDADGSGGENIAYSYTTIDNYISNHAEIEDITVYTDNPVAAGYMHFAGVDDEIRETEWYRRATSQVGVFWVPMEKRDRYGNSYWNLALVRKITVIGSEYQAVLVIQLSDNYLQTRIRSSEYRIMASADDGRIFTALQGWATGKNNPFISIMMIPIMSIWGLSGRMQTGSSQNIDASPLPVRQPCLHCYHA